MSISLQCEGCNRLDAIESELAAAKAVIEKLKADNENLTWNLAGCSTFALGYKINDPFSKEWARPAMFDVLRLAKREKRLRGALEELTMNEQDKAYRWFRIAQSALDGKGGEA
jgi:hypothetical protein